MSILLNPWILHQFSLPQHLTELTIVSSVNFLHLSPRIPHSPGSCPCLLLTPSLSPLLFHIFYPHLFMLGAQVSVLELHLLPCLPLISWCWISSIYWWVPQLYLLSRPLPSTPGSNMQLSLEISTWLFQSYFKIWHIPNGLIPIHAPPKPYSILRLHLFQLANFSFQWVRPQPLAFSLYTIVHTRQSNQLYFQNVFRMCTCIVILPVVPVIQGTLTPYLDAGHNLQPGPHFCSCCLWHIFHKAVKDVPLKHKSEQDIPLLKTLQ